MGRLVSCMRKTRYVDRSAAIAAGVAAMQRPDNHTTYLRPYACAYCKGWHLTHQLPRGSA